ncbi:hypothetical protein GCM10010123_09740 [Pilimelia anulata]|uniref:Right handed beta helix domain-containing protein n=1 Tax=Pilimelia anulata TaxID=53371 RepID=A0A8J3B0C1_9ACTN|nr:right-handed parallel beta-helix repeat-containing protein [Pilimelia anulata]GGJ82024.1 hypothetical protein GCM10010123_09740 [Pilimelia anulata]
MNRPLARRPSTRRAALAAAVAAVVAASGGALPAAAGPGAAPAPTAPAPLSPVAPAPPAAVPAGTVAVPAPAANPAPSDPPTPPVPGPAAGVPTAPPAAGPVVPAPLDRSPAVLAQQAALVAAEEARIATLRAVEAGAGEQWRAAPYRLRVAGGFTLVLTPRPEPYTFADLAALAPTTFVPQGRRAYLLTESLLVTRGATLDLARPATTELRLASDPGGYVSIVSIGGRLLLTGAPRNPLTVTSWNLRRTAPDADTADGRAYVRTIGGAAVFTAVRFQRLGFGGGGTGGVSLGGPATPAAPPRRAIPDAAVSAPVRPAAGTAVPLIVPDARYTAAALPYTPPVVRRSRFVGNAFGLVLDGAPRAVVAGSTVLGSLADGVVLHRGTTDARIDGTTASGNRGSGFVLADRAARNTLAGCTAEANRQDGFTLTGDAGVDHLPYGRAPDAGAGTAVTGGVARNNLHYGIAVDGAAGARIQGNWVVGGDMGIVLRRTAGATVTHNQVRESAQHGVAVLDGAATVADNVIADVRNGVYVRDAVAAVRGNTITKASTHGIEFLGGTDGSAVAENLLATTGGSALDLSGAAGEIDLLGNRTVERRPEPTGWRALAQRTTPTTVLWALVLLALAGTAFRRRARPGGKLPYARTAPPRARGPRFGR